jgi:NAD(P)-dependent dehydrogenase (short-subunit alcohol dehydrogenase family)
MSPSDGYGCVTWHSIGSALRDLYGEAIASKPLPRVLERPHTHTEDGRNAGQRVSHVKLLTVLVVGFSWNVITKPRPAAGNSSLGGSCCSRWLRCMPMRHGSIIAISSWSGLVGIAGAAEYAVSKSAVRSHESVALDCAEQWLAIARTQSIPRPYILTPMWSRCLASSRSARSGCRPWFATRLCCRSGGWMRWLRLRFCWRRTHLPRLP